MSKGGPDVPVGSRTQNGARLHIPVLLDEVIAALEPRDSCVFLDGTFGAGGYSKGLLDVSNSRVMAIDRDPSAIADGQAMVTAYPGRLTLVEGRFSQMEKLAAKAGYSTFDGIALDIGVSSMQVDSAARGFSFAKDGPLDMRMGAIGPSAADVVNGMDETELANVIYLLGEERRSRAVARAIVRRRETEPFSTTLDFADTVRRAVSGRPGRIHPATRTFQALRIFVNAELDELVHGLAAAERLLKPQGRLAVVSFHSLEDRIVKRFLRARFGRTGGGSRHRPQVAAGPAPSFVPISGGPARPGKTEQAANPRARSARLRAAIRTEAPAWDLDEKSLGAPEIKTAFTG